MQMMAPFAQRFPLNLVPPQRPARPVTVEFSAAVRRRPATASSLSLLCAVALTGLVVIAAYLPVFLTTAHGIGQWAAWAFAAAMVAVAAVTRMAGAWWTSRRPAPVPFLVCYAIAAILCLVLAAGSPAFAVAVPLLVGAAICDGLASGVLLALIGVASQPSGVASQPPDGIEQPGDTDTVAGLLDAGQPEPAPTAMTVVIVGEPTSRREAADVATRLARLAVTDELVVVYGSDENQPGPIAHTVVAELRAHLPRHHVVALRVTPHLGALGRDAAVLDEFLEIGSLPIAVTTAKAVRDVAAELSTYLGADRVLKVSRTTRGADLRQVWPRRTSTGGTLACLTR
jgi:NNP family nitrate/nitrite transporter-like MFS transporter